MRDITEAEGKSSNSSQKDVWAIIGPLQRDCEQAGKNLQDNDTPFNRRTYVRTVFASIEAVIYVLKQHALQHRQLGGFSDGEIAMLEEKTYTPDKGKGRAKPKFLRLNENFPFAIGVLYRVLKSPFKLDKKGKEWEAFKKAIEVRNRITHPKLLELLGVNDEEIEAVGVAYRLVVGSVVDSVVEGNRLLRRVAKEMCEKHGIPCPHFEEIQRNRKGGCP